VSENGTDRPLVAGTRIRLSFKDGQIGASAGCNLLGGGYRLDGGRLVADQLVTTDMGCDPARHAQDAWLAAFLGGRPAFRLAGNDLSLQRDGTIVELLDRRVADPDRPFVGTTWRVDSIITGQTVSSVPAGAVASLVLRPDGRFAVETGCNSGGGTYTIEGTSIRLSPINLTERACAGPAGELEQAVLAVLQTGPLIYTVEAATLTLTAGERGLGFQAA
jgi:heat shock protein HslJ